MSAAGGSLASLGRSGDWKAHKGVDLKKRNDELVRQCEAVVARAADGKISRLGESLVALEPDEDDSEMRAAIVKEVETLRKDILPGMYSQLRRAKALQAATDAVLKEADDGAAGDVPYSTRLAAAVETALGKMSAMETDPSYMALKMELDTVISAATGGDDDIFVKPAAEVTLTCPLTRRRMVDPVVTLCRHVYSRQGLEDYKRQKTKNGTVEVDVLCPTAGCKKPIDFSKVTEHLPTKQALLALAEEEEEAAAAREALAASSSRGGAASSAGGDDGDGDVAIRGGGRGGSAAGGAGIKMKPDPGARR